jgi:hypothetical protein
MTTMTIAVDTRSFARKATTPPSAMKFALNAARRRFRNQSDHQHQSSPIQTIYRLRMAISLLRLPRITAKDRVWAAMA